MRHHIHWLRYAVFIMVLALIIPMIVACGDDDDATPGVTPPAIGTTPDTDETPAVGETPDADETPTVDGADATPTEDDGTPGTGSGTGEMTRVEGGDRMMGFEIEEGQQGGVFAEASFSDISTLMPVVTSDAATNDYLAAVFESLMQPHPETLEPVGRLAEAWEYNEDASVWVVYLQQNVTWHDGEQFTADDVKFTYELHMNEEVGSSYTADLRSKIESIEVIDDHTVQFNLTGPLADFPLDIGVYNIVAEHVWADVEPANVASDPGATGQDASRVIGTGPFTFGEWQVGNRVTALRYDDYWDGAPYLDEYVFQVVQDQSAGVLLLQRGDVDYMEGIPESAVQDFQGTAVDIYEVPTLNFTFYTLNMDPERTTLFQDVETRQALMHAIDREALIESIRFGYGEVAVGTMPVLSWAYNPEGIEMNYEYDVDRANELLDQAGWELGADGVRIRDGERLAFTMYTNAGNQVREAYLVALQQYWGEIGVEMTPQFEPFPALVERITETYDFEAVLIGFQWSATPDQSTMFACEGYGAGYNFGRYCNEEVDALLEEALRESDQERRIELYTEFQNLVMQDLPVAILDFPEAIIGVDQRVHNLFPNAPNARFNMHTWWVEQ